jgi:hypothetical protein
VTASLTRNNVSSPLSSSQTSRKNGAVFTEPGVVDRKPTSDSGTLLALRGHCVLRTGNGLPFFFASAISFRRVLLPQQLRFAVDHVLKSDPIVLCRLTCKRIQCDEVGPSVTRSKRPFRQRNRDNADTTMLGHGRRSAQTPRWFAAGGPALVALRRHSLLHDLAARLTNRIQRTTEGHRV